MNSSRQETGIAVGAGAAVGTQIRSGKRTLQSYRERGIIPFSSGGGKYFYKEADVAAYLESKTKRKKA